jgi:predicted RNA binding protein YcfA (HicA-like mRNA interferase family)
MLKELSIIFFYGINIPMGRKLRGIRGKDAIRPFIKAGGKLRPGKGDHINIKMPNGIIITFPGRKELKIGLLKNAIQKAGLTIEQFLDLL